MSRASEILEKLQITNESVEKIDEASQKPGFDKNGKSILLQALDMIITTGDYEKAWEFESTSPNSGLNDDVTKEQWISFMQKKVKERKIQKKQEKDLHDLYLKTFN